MKAARETKVPARVIKLLDGGKQYPEGLGIHMEVKSARDLAAIQTLTALKLAH